MAFSFAHASRRSRAFAMLSALSALVSASSYSTNATAQSLPLPSIQIGGFDAGSPSGGCTAPAANLNGLANGNANHSDSFAMLVNGALVYTWEEGERMEWVPVGGGAFSGYSVNGTLGAIAANSTITARIVTYGGANASATNPTTGQLPVFVSEISWNCSTGAQVGAVVNRDLRTAQAVPTLTSTWLGILFVLLAYIGRKAIRLQLRRRFDRVR
ncbi:MAG: hypothetical protein ACRDAM_11925 [Casimicrobium sp.]